MSGSARGQRCLQLAKNNNEGYRNTSPRPFCSSDRFQLLSPRCGHPMQYLIKVCRLYKLMGSGPAERSESAPIKKQSQVMLRSENMQLKVSILRMGKQCASSSVQIFSSHHATGQLRFWMHEEDKRANVCTDSDRGNVKILASRLKTHKRRLFCLRVRISTRTRAIRRLSTRLCFFENVCASAWISFTLPECAIFEAKR